MSSWEKQETLEVIPDPVSLIESMRAVGYSVEAAIADLVDNSLSAIAKNIEIKYDASDDPFIAILDDGRGMDPDELTNAMRHGSSNPSCKRDPDDLGRFGLGLKTASLSQCRKLTVVSRKGGGTSARQWNLDVVQQSRQWLVVVPKAGELEALPMFSQLQALDSGTLVVWQDLDRLTAGALNPQAEMTAKLSPLYDHLALVFHRYTQKEDAIAPVRMAVNGLQIPPRDPFLRNNTFRQPLEGQVIRHERGIVQVSPYILPPVSHLSPDEISLAGGREGLRKGFRYRLHNKHLTGKPDLALSRYRSVVFVHGCFWHRHSGCKYAYTPKSNRVFWKKKLSSNVLRDKKVRRQLKKEGWQVHVIWECQLRERDLKKLADKIRITKRRSGRN